jgi:hypothetical protein
MRCGALWSSEPSPVAPRLRRQVRRPLRGCCPRADGAHCRCQHRGRPHHPGRSDTSQHHRRAPRARQVAVPARGAAREAPGHCCCGGALGGCMRGAHCGHARSTRHCVSRPPPQVLPILKPVDKCWQPSDFLPPPEDPDFIDKVREKTLHGPDLKAREAPLPIRAHSSRFHMGEWNAAGVRLCVPVRGRPPRTRMAARMRAPAHACIRPCVHASCVYARCLHERRWSSCASAPPAFPTTTWSCSLVGAGAAAVVVRGSNTLDDCRDTVTVTLAFQHRQQLPR